MFSNMDAARNNNTSPTDNNSTFKYLPRKGIVDHIRCITPILNQ